MNDASFIKEMKEEEEEQLYEAKCIEEPVRLTSDPVTRFSKFDALVTHTQLYTEFILEKVLEQSNEQAKLVPLVTGAKLKPYQIEGVKRLIALWLNGLNGILADEMRLGGKIQSIGILAHLKENGLNGPYMIIAPATTLTNWVDEISRLAPSLMCLIYCGDKLPRTEIMRKLMLQTIGSYFPIIVTSYETATSDAKLLARYSWKYVIFDEVKNMECELLLELRRLPMDTKLLLTRTPSQNNLSELWSPLNFVLPTYSHLIRNSSHGLILLGKEVRNNQKKISSIEGALVISKLHAILDAFLLRQTQNHVENTPPRTKGAFCCNTKDGINLSKDYAVRDAARSSGQSSQEPAAEVAYENGGEGSPNLPSTQSGLEDNKKVKRRRTDDAVLSLLGEIKSTLQASFRSAEPVLVPKATSPREILEALKRIPDLTRADFLRAYGSLIRDDRQFESLMVLPVDMRKDWLLMETGKN